MYHKISHFLSSQTGPTRFFFTTLGEAYNNAARRSRKRLRLHDRTRYVWRPAISTRTQPGERSLGRRGGRRGAARGRPRRSRPNKNGAVDPGASQASTLATPRRRRSPFRTEHLDIHTRCMHTYSMHAYILDVHTYRLRRLGGGGRLEAIPRLPRLGGPGSGQKRGGGEFGREMVPSRGALRGGGAAPRRPYTVRAGDTLSSIARKRGKPSLPYTHPPLPPLPARARPSPAPTPVSASRSVLLSPSPGDGPPMQAHPWRPREREGGGGGGRAQRRREGSR